MELNPNQALEMWCSTIVEGVRRDAPDLTARQMAVLLLVYMTPAPHTVRGMAERLNISKPAITRALDKLGKLEFIRRKEDDIDRRSVLVQRTVKGSIFLREYGEIIAQAALEFEPG
ncbi:MAG: MarR family transcriptional regulator [Alphaproteobacteria bacterium]|jgi:DNA-binding MarR family transcriptional regulator|nr:MarR family transcriptional regulator [Rhodospirillaceae bacterium]MDP6427056.1 MarR family transcriptional regulator [Rhodospirillales bacterium]MDP6645081.1 MarR family transcriptional regulator [Rhodospirillales bacterium]MDP6819412.1 MarR family transcriptional regulator [Alphaproteobacteria bacterium]|tara:strand:- start:820 stop:1167 length:348 start_codon:yes stop_codon:yes gene_type:complete